MREDQRNKIKELREQSKNTDDSHLKADITKEIGRLIMQGVKELKEQVDKNNTYKLYVIENQRVITKKYGFDKVVESYDKAVELLKTIDIREIFNIAMKLNVPFESKLFPKIEEWEGQEFDSEQEAIEALRKKSENKRILISKIVKTKFNKYKYNVIYTLQNRMVYINEINEQYRLFFKRNKGVARVVEEESFDIINLYEIIMDVGNTYKAIKELCGLFDIKIRYCMEQEEKYNFNIDKIYDKEYIKTNYSALYKYISRYLYILEELLEEGKKNIISTKFSFSGESVFFCSGNSLHAKLKEKRKNILTIDPKSQNQLSKIINLFCILGLILKLKNNEVPMEMRRKPRKNEKFQNYFIVRKYTEYDFVKSEEIVNKLIQKGVSAMKVTGDICKEVLKEQYNNVYLNNEKSTKNVKDEISNKEQDKETKFISELEINEAIE